MKKIFSISLIFLAVTTSIIFLNFNHDSRPLTNQEIKELRSVFFEDVIYSEVMISTANLPPTLAAFVLDNHIIFREEYSVDDFSQDYLKMARLVHEIGHVWANLSVGFHSSLIAFKEHFIYKDHVYTHKALSGNKALSEFRFEQQCRILSDYFINSHLKFDISTYEMTIYRTINK